MRLEKMLNCAFSRLALDRFLEDKKVGQLIVEPEDWRKIANRMPPFHPSYYKDEMWHFDYPVGGGQIVTISSSLPPPTHFTEIIDLTKA